MTDINQEQTHPSDQLVDINNIKDVENLHQQFHHYTHEQIKEAIQSAGPMKTDIEEYLKNQS